MNASRRRHRPGYDENPGQKIPSKVISQRELPNEISEEGNRRARNEGSSTLSPSVHNSESRQGNTPTSPRTEPVNVLAPEDMVMSSEVTASSHEVTLNNIEEAMVKGAASSLGLESDEQVDIVKPVKEYQMKKIGKKQFHFFYLILG